MCAVVRLVLGGVGCCFFGLLCVLLCNLVRFVYLMRVRDCACLVWHVFVCFVCVVLCCCLCVFLLSLCAFVWMCLCCL